MMSTDSGSNSSSPSATANLTLSSSPHNLAFSVANETASDDMSVPRKIPLSSSFARLNIMHPLPVPRSTMNGLSEEDEAEAESPLACFSTRSTSSSVSGLGIKARLSHLSVSVRKSHSPRTYCRGSPPESRTMARRIASRWLSETGRSRCDTMKPRPHLRRRAASSSAAVCASGTSCCCRYAAARPMMSFQTFKLIRTAGLQYLRREHRPAHRLVQASALWMSHPHREAQD